MYFVRHRADWSKRANYIRTRHHVEPAWADEAINDPAAFWLDPDTASISGRSVRVIGYSARANAVITVILLPGDDDQDERADGDWWGVNAWQSNDRDQNVYHRRDHEQD